MSETLLKFPCDFPIKVVGQCTVDFETLVVALVREHVHDLGEAAVRSRPSQGGNYLAITITVRATSQEQLDAIYRSLSGHDDIMMVL